MQKCCLQARQAFTFLLQLKKVNKKSRHLTCKPKNDLHFAKIIKLLPPGRQTMMIFQRFISTIFLTVSSQGER